MRRASREGGLPPYLEQELKPEFLSPEPGSAPPTISHLPHNQGGGAENMCVRERDRMGVAQ